MLKKKLLVVALAASFAASAATEDLTFSSNVAITSDYLFRGISQTGTNPALQGGFDAAHASGLYAGVWGSNISWLSDAGVATRASVELDTYVGFSGSYAEDFTYDVGYLRYNYPGSYGGAVKADTDELYGAVGYKWVTVKYSYSLGDTFGVNDASGTDYLELNASLPLADLGIADTGITFSAHLGRQEYSGANKGAGATSLSYTDYKLEASKDFGGYVFALAYSDTNASAAYTVLGKDLGQSTAVASLSRSF